MWRDDGGGVRAYYTIVVHVLARDELPRNLGHGLPSQIPAVLLARLALDRSLQGQGLGSALLAEALGRIVAATEVVGARFVVVDAIDDHATAFYEHHGFRRLPGTMRLVKRIADVAADLG